MRFLRDISIGIKVLIPPAIVILVLAIVSLLAIYGLEQQRKALSAVNDIALEKIALVDEFVALSEQVQSDVFRIAVLRFMDLPEEEVQPTLTRLEQGVSDLDVIYGQILTKWPLDEYERNLLEQMKGPLDDFTTQAQQAVTVVSTDPAFGVLLVRSSAVSFSEFRDTLSEFRAHQQAKIVRTEAEANQKAQLVGVAIIALTLSIALVGVLTTVMISTRWISQPIQSMTQLMQQLAAGDLAVEVGDGKRQDEIGAMARAVAVFRDNAIEKQIAEEALRAEEERVQQYLDIAGVVLVALDAEGNIALVNRKGLELLGYEEDELIGQSWVETCVPAVFRDQVHDVFRKLMAGTIEPIEHYENPVRTRYGEERIVAWHNALLKDADGHIVGTLSSGEDITETVRLEATRTQAEEALRESHRRLEETLAELRETQDKMVQQERLAAVGQLAGGIAHDFNNLLTAIMLYAHMPLSNPNLPPELRRSFETIFDESQHAAELVQQILDFSRRSPLNTQPFDLKPFVKEAVRMLERTIPENIRICIEAGQETYVVDADATRIQQVLMNLALNSRDAMRDGGDLCISLSHVDVQPDSPPPAPDMAPGLWVLLSIRDSGTGIPPEAQPHIFEPFFTTKAVGEGTGLGLAQVYGIVKQHGGHIGFETEVGQGTTFHVYLPAHQANVEDTDARAGTAIPMGSGETILLVEDEEMIRLGGQTVLESLGYRVLTAEDGQAALKVYQVEEKVDLVITDVVMPRMGGKSLLYKLREMTPNLKALAITGYVAQQDVRSLRADGFADIVHKPFDVDTLASIVRQVLDTD